MPRPLLFAWICFAPLSSCLFVDRLSENSLPCAATGLCALQDIPDGVHGFGFLGEKKNAYCGCGVSAGGDFNGDGVSDLIVGGNHRTYIVFGTANSSIWAPGTVNISFFRDGVHGFALTGIDAFGFPVHWAGDMNGDGLDEVIIGAVEADNDRGEAYVCFGTRNTTWWSNGTLDVTNCTDGIHGFRLTGDDHHDELGIVSATGDINGDGFADIMVGCPMCGGRVGYGRAYVVFGSSDPKHWGNGTNRAITFMDGKRGFSLTGAAGDEAAYNLDTGDLNNDGIIDLFVGAQNGESTGIAYVVFGSKSSTAWGDGTLQLTDFRDGVRGVALIGELAGDSCGQAVGNAGDVNGDGIDDIVVGAPMNDDTIGEAYVVFGTRNQSFWALGNISLGQTSDGVRGFMMKGEQIMDHSGVAVISAGDVNSDGLDDFLVGGLGYDEARGITYVVFGSKDPSAWGNGRLKLGDLRDGKRGFALVGTNSGDYTGVSLAAGDVNGDKISDMLISACYADNLAGIAFVVFGWKN